MLKVVYFDEGSATDLISIENEGNLIQENSDVSATNKSAGGESEAEVGVGKGLKKLLNLMFVNVDGKAKVEADILKSSSKLAQSSITNTILTDFLDLLNGNKNPGIYNFDNYELSVVNNSIAYYQRISPYLFMTDGKMKIDENFNLDIEKIHETLRSGKGYYELIATSDREKVILRFNNTAFKNNYSVSDLDQMDLSIYAIKVGSMDFNLLDFNNLMDSLTNGASEQMPNNHEDIVDFYENEPELTNDLQGTGDRPDILDVYDVILAGVSR